MDVLICAAGEDVNYVMDLTIRSILKNFEPLNNIFIVTSNVQAVNELVKRIGLISIVNVLDDSDVLSVREMKLGGWIKQQIIKLKADQICSTENICIIGSDAVLLKKVLYEDLIENNQPIIYFNRNSYPSLHLEYERCRLENIAKILDIKPKRTYLLGDFIMELMIFNSTYLKNLRVYLNSLYGKDGLAEIVPSNPKTLKEKLLFGEWSLYCMYVLDVLAVQVPIRMSTEKYMMHIHSKNYYKRFSYDAKIVHFVAKDLDVDDIRKKVENYIRE